jgi:4-amino-4-deoxy-L-arabinose transferase-like glycosyltransferase
VSPRASRATELAALGVVLAAAGVLFSRNLATRPNYDEGVYLASMDALRHGQELGSDVFASQPPGFYLLLQLVGVFSGDSTESARVGFLVLALIGLVGAFLVGRALTGPAAGLAAAALLAIMPPWPSEAARVDADVPSVSLALAALALAAYGVRADARPWLPAAAGAVFALAVSVKLVALLAVVPIVALALQAGARRRLAAFAVGALAVGVALLAPFILVLDELWQGVVTFHRDARSLASPISNGEQLRDFLDFETPAAWLTVLGVLASVTVWRRVWPLWTWTAAAVVFVLWQKPLFDHHLVVLSAALALPVGVALGSFYDRVPRRASTAVAMLALLLLVVVGFAQQWRRIGLAVTADEPAVLWAARRLEECAEPGRLVASDQPIAAFWADRQLPGQLVDTSLVRLSTGSLPPAQVLEEVRRARAPVVFAGRSFLVQPAILTGLRRRFGEPRRFGAARLYGCRQAPRS